MVEFSTPCDKIMRDMPANDETFEERESIIQKTISANVRAYRFVERKIIGGYTAVEKRRPFLYASRRHNLR